MENMAYGDLHVHELKAHQDYGPGLLLWISLQTLQNIPPKWSTPCKIPMCSEVLSTTKIIVVLVSRITFAVIHLHSCSILILTSSRFEEVLSWSYANFYIVRSPKYIHTGLLKLENIHFIGSVCNLLIHNYWCVAPVERFHACLVLA